MDDIEQQAIRNEGYDPDDPVVLAALSRVTRDLRTLRRILGDDAPARQVQPARVWPRVRRT